jgi:general secretion pathway protein D
MEQPAPAGYSALFRPCPCHGRTTATRAYSVVVNNVNVRNCCLLARDAKLNVDIFPALRAWSRWARSPNLPQLLNRVSSKSTRYEIDGPNLVVMPDSPYLRV